MSKHSVLKYQRLEQARAKIREAEADLGKLTRGQRRDLLADQFPHWPMEVIRAIVATLGEGDGA